MANVEASAGNIQEMVRQLLGQTAPLRDQTVSQLSAVLGGAPASSLPAYAPNRAAMEGQFGQARNTLMQSLPRGGYLAKALADLEGRRAEGVAGLESSTRNNAFNQALQIGFGQVPSYLSGESSAAGILAQADAARKAQQAQTASGIGTGLGLLASIYANWGK